MCGEATRSIRVHPARLTLPVQRVRLIEPSVVAAGPRSTSSWTSALTGSWRLSTASSCGGTSPALPSKSSVAHQPQLSLRALRLTARGTALCQEDPAARTDHYGDEAVRLPGAPGGAQPLPPLDGVHTHDNTKHPRLCNQSPSKQTLVPWVSSALRQSLADKRLEQRFGDGLARRFKGWACHDAGGHVTQAAQALHEHMLDVATGPSAPIEFYLHLAEQRLDDEQLLPALEVSPAPPPTSARCRVCAAQARQGVV